MTTILPAEKPLLFDQGKLKTLTAAEIETFFTAANKQDFRTMSSFFAKVIAQTPESWGEPDKPETYIQLPYFKQFKPIIQQFADITNDTQDTDDKPLPVQFDFDRMTAAGMTDFFEAIRNRDYLAISIILAKVVTECPASWGKTSDPETYRQRPFFSDYAKLLKQFIAAMGDEAKN